MKGILYILCLLYLLMTGCSGRVDSLTEKYLENRENIVNVHNKIVPIPMEEHPISAFSNLYVMDKYLVVRDSKSYDGVIYFFDKNTFQYIANFTPIGPGNYELTNPGEICLDEEKGKLYVFDYGKFKMVSYDIDSVSKKPYSYNFQLKAKLSPKLYPVFCNYITDTLSVVSVLEVIGDYQETHQLAGLWNLQTGEIKIGYEHSDVKKKRMMFAASKEYGIYVKCYKYNDLMTICNLDGSLKYNVYGPHWGDESKIYYHMDVRFCDDKILALYVGKDPSAGENAYLPSQIVVYTKDGEYVKTLETNYELLHFCYDKANHRIIFLTNNEMQFCYLSLDGIV